MHDDLADEIHLHCDRLLERVDQLKRYLVLARDLHSEDPKAWYFATLEARGSAIVGVCAELEALTKFVLQRTHEELNGIKIRHDEISPCMRQVAVHTAFESLRELQDHSKVWERRLFTTTLDAQKEVVQFPVSTKTAQPPLDGKTLKSEHFLRIWSIYGLPGDPFPFAAWSASLLKLAGLRNDVAHGNLPFPEVFKQAGVTIPEVERYVDDLSCFAIHFVDQWCVHVQSGGYRI